MSDESSARLGLRLLVPGQAQKEMIHNEALTMIDIALAAQVVAAGVTTPPADPAEGDCWIVGGGATGAWAGHEDAIAGWTAGGWRFVTPREGLSAWDADTGAVARFRDGAWRIREPLGQPVDAIDEPAGGSTVDNEARTAISAILMALQHFGLSVPA